MRFKIFILSALFTALLSGVLLGHYKPFPQTLLLFVNSVISQNTDYQHSQHYKNRVDLLSNSLKYRSFDLVFVGDSHIEIFPWSMWFPDKETLSLGIGGDTSKGILDRLEPILLAEPKCVVLLVGINDVSAGFSLSESKANFEQLLNQLSGRTISVNVLEIPFTRGRGEAMNLKVQRLNHVLRNMVSSKDQQRFIDLNNSLSEQDMLKPDYTTDGVHLNFEGYSVLLNLLMNNMEC